jgi:UDP-N-acetylmuramoyl-L-alanyl-D-glutamate--2,6-diaminopimelate ligase
MGEIAGKLADFSFVTTDDPHGESPAQIIADIEDGFRRIGGESRKHYLAIEDRRTAIEHALHMAADDDIVVIAGRGHEKFQDYNGVKIDIDDREVVREIIGKRPG